MKNAANIIPGENYQHFLAEIVNLVQYHRVQAVQSVQTISNQLYWNIGELIIKKQQEYGWGKSIVKKLSGDLNVQIGEGVSWSPRNLWLMRQLVSEYSKVNQLDSDLEKVKQAASLIGILKQTDSEFVNPKQMVLAVPWWHNIMIIQKIKDHKARLFYLQSTIKNQYSRAVLLHQINADAYGNYLSHKSQHNFETALPEHFLEQAKESIKSVYSLDFLDINKPVTERLLEKTMVEKVKRLMMELGYGFCFIGNQYRITLGEKDYYIDLLFYQLHFDILFF